MQHEELKVENKINTASFVYLVIIHFKPPEILGQYYSKTKFEKKHENSINKSSELCII